MFKTRLGKDLLRNKWLYLMILPVIIYYIMFHYVPMYGAIIAFKQFVPSKGILGSEWVGFKHFADFFSSIYFFRVIKNTILLSFTNLVCGFPAPIILALLLNEIKSPLFRRITQTITYMPHFITLVVVAGIIRYFTLSDGLINDILAFFGSERISFLQQPEAFRPIYVISEIWQQVGWGTIIYLAAISGIDQQQYEAARIDGATKFQQIRHITFPGILPTVMIMLILALGNIMNIGFEKIILLYSASIYETADVISTYVYRKGILEFNYGYSAAVGLFNSFINFGILLLANYVSKRVSKNSLW